MESSMSIFNKKTKNHFLLKSTVSILSSALISNAAYAQTTPPQTPSIVYPDGVVNNVYNTPVLGKNPFYALMCAYKDSPDFSKITNTEDKLINADLIKNILINETADKAGLNFYWHKVSQGKFSIEGSKVFGWYRLPYDKAWYVKNSGDGTALASHIFRMHCMNLAAKDGFSYDPAWGLIFIEQNTGFDTAYKLKGNIVPALQPDGCYGFGRDKTTGECIIDPPKGLDSEFEAAQMGSVIDIPSSILSDPKSALSKLNVAIGHSLGLNGSNFYSANTSQTPKESNKWDSMSHFYGLGDITKTVVIPGSPIGFHKYKLGWYDINQVISYDLNSPKTIINLSTASLNSKEPKIAFLKYKDRPSAVEYSIEVRGVKETSTLSKKSDYFDKQLKQPVVIIHRHDPDEKLKACYMDNMLCNKNHYVSNLVITDNKQPRPSDALSDSITLIKGESWSSTFRADDKTKFKITVLDMGDSHATLEIKSIP